MEQTLLIEIEFPYIEKLLMSKKRNPKYYSLKRGVGRKEIIKGSRIHQKLQNQIYKSDSNLFILDENNQKIIANKRSVGTPKYWIINFQDIYNGNISRQARNNIVNKLKTELRPWIQTSNIKNIDFNDLYPLRTELFIYTEEMAVDIDNKGVMYHKTIQDIIKENYIIDDSPEYINDTGRIKWIKSDMNIMKFRIFKSDNND